MAMQQQRISRWYFGGLASAGAACITHPLDLLKVTLQTQQDGKLSIIKLTGQVIKNQGKVKSIYVFFFCNLFLYILQVLEPYTMAYQLL